MARKSTPIQGQTDLFEFLFAESEETQNEQLRQDRTGELEDAGSEGVRTDQQPRGTLRPDRGDGHAAGAPASGRAGRTRPDGRGLPGEGGPTTSGQEPGGGNRQGRNPDPAPGHLGTDAGGREPGRRDLPGDPTDEPSRTGAGERAGLDAPFVPASQDQLAPSGTQSRFQANIQALRTYRQLQTEDREATTEEKRTLARWGSWGATGLADVFDEYRPEYEPERAELHELLSDQEYRAAARTVLNAHYTDPAYAQAMWDGLADLGFTSGRVLEPGCGAGTFIGLAPESTEMTGVELDPVTAGIAQAIYPGAQIRAESFAESAIPENYFDATIGNVPFAQTKLHDPRHNPNRAHSMHNHFILKSLAMTKPGGVVAVISSSFTLDAENPASREAIARYADLLGAVRLPQRAFMRSAGTDVTTDVLVFRKRHENETPLDSSWTQSTELSIDGRTVRQNAYYQQHPERVLGTQTPGTDRFGNTVLTVVRDDLSTAPQALHDQLDTIAAEAREYGRAYDANTQPSNDLSLPILTPDEDRPLDGHITAHDNGTFTVYRSDGTNEELTVPRTQQAELRELLSLRDQARALISAEARQRADTPEITAARSALLASYEAYHDAHGPLNRFTETTTKTGAIIRRGAPVMSKLREDPYGSLVMSLEVFDNATQTALPATLLQRRVLEPRRAVTRVDSPADALALSLDQTGGVDIDYIAGLLDTDRDSAVSELGDTIYPLPGEDPEHVEYVTREEYLSGDVREKLRQAEATAVQDSSYQRNVNALRPIIPADLGPSDIEGRIGSAWIPDTDHQQFLREVVGDTSARMLRVHGATWNYEGNSYANPGGWGTDAFPAFKLMGYMAEQKAIVVYQEGPDGERQVNATATAMANDKAERLQERFGQWIWEDPARAQRLAEQYNNKFNNLVLRDYTRAGESLTLPGLVKTFAPRPHQRTAVARMISEPSVGLFHQVGAGKTAEMVMGTMELKRLGMVSKPCVVVPNHMLEQFSREWLSMYPQAKLLPASSDDITAAKRRGFVGRAATNDWDAIIMTHSAFGRISLKSETEISYLQSEVDLQRENLRRAQERMQEDNTRSSRGVKNLEAAIQRAEERIKDLQEKPRDPGITFEETGIDYLCVDELHEFKNLDTPSRIPDANIVGSKKASDLHMKVDYLRKTNGDRVITGATGTPIANSMTEMYVMTRYLRPDLLHAAGIEDFDSWAATFGSVVREMEMTVAGGNSYKMKSRFAKFQNVPELLRQFHTFGDVKTQEDLNLPVPEIAARPSDGRRAPEMLIVPPTPEQEAYMEQLAARYENMTFGGPDNALAITGDGRKAAADMRLIDPSYPDPFDAGYETKVTRTADVLAEVYRDTKDTTYLIPGTDDPHPTPGALQAVFCDLGTPKADDRFTMYQAIKDACVERGIPAEKVRFIHDAKNDAQKERLFEECRSGDVAVLIGSTQKMGVGTNIQARLAHLVHIDAPWRPADVEQRNGRILRQGNQNPQVRITQVATEKSVDAFMWQTLERKAKFSNQVMRGKLDVREMEDFGDATVSLAEMKAASSGNMLLIDKSNADQELARLERLKRGHDQDQTQLAFSKTMWSEERTELLDEIPQIRAAAERSTETAGEKFRMSINGGAPLASRTEAAAAMQEWVARNATQRPPMRGESDLGVFATLGGHDWRVVLQQANPAELHKSGVHLVLDDAPAMRVQITRADMLDSKEGIIRRMENLLPKLPGAADSREARAADLDRRVEDVATRIGQPFPHAQALEEARTEVKRLDKAIRDYQTKNSDEGRQEAEQAEQEPRDGSPIAVMDPPHPTPHVQIEQDELDAIRAIYQKDCPPASTGHTPPQERDEHRRHDDGHNGRDASTGLDL